MTLRRKMAYAIAAMIVGLLLISAASLWGLNGLHHEFDSAIQGYEQLRRVYEISAHIATARTLLTLAPPDESRALAEIHTAAGKLDLFAPTSPAANPYAPVRAQLIEAARQLDHAIANHPAGHPDTLLDPLNTVLIHAANRASDIRQTIEQKQSAADAKRHATMLILAILAAVIILAAITLGIAQYRSVARPLSRLASAARTIAAGRFSNRVPATGPTEFVALAEDFNRMAAELDGLYRQLEEKVAAKSKQLVRSERLASVGYLAAGVAHEVNNPIGIIAGHAELSLQQLQRNPGPHILPDIENTLRIICDESFRCKEIVARLLSLARPSDDHRRPVSLAAIASSVVATIAGLGTCRSRRLTLHADDTTNLCILANEGEIKQVILNLAINALEAVPPDTGQVHLAVVRTHACVELTITDNGRGIAPDMLEHIFEPFFTGKRGAAQPGTGLGLSIVHAIVQSHGGQIHAHSDGPGQGARFIVQLPPAPPKGPPA